MKRSKLSEAQIAFVLKQAEDGTSVGEVCRKAGIVLRQGYETSGCGGHAA
jgi:putative transposase